MEQAYTVALVGFAQSEAGTFESFFRMAADRRSPAYRVQEEVGDAQLLIVNADNPQAIHLVSLAELPGRVLLIGQYDGGTGWMLEKKPVKLVNVLTALDRLVGVRSRVPSPAAKTFEAAHAFQSSQIQPLDASMRRVTRRAPVPPMKAAMAPKGRPDTEFAPTEPMVRAAPEPGSIRKIMPKSAPGVMRLTDFGGIEDLAPTPDPMAGRSRRSRLSQADRQQANVPETASGDMLLVSDSLVEGRILHKRFARYGLKIDWSREGKQATAMLKAHRYRLVVIDRVSGSPDAFQICRVARQQRLPNGLPPTVLMFAPTAGSMDRIKAGLAGSDAYLSRSVSEGDLYRVLGQHRLVSMDGFAPTDIGY